MRTITETAIAEQRALHPELEIFCKALLGTLEEISPKPRDMPYPLHLADVRHWVRRRWPLPVEAMYAMNFWARDFIQEEGWICRPHGTELAAVLRLREPNTKLGQQIPIFLRTDYEDGFVRRVTAIFSEREEHSFASEEELLEWLEAPERFRDLWSLFRLERVEADQASREWLEDRRIDGLCPKR
jgi:hypothetical protein